MYTKKELAKQDKEMGMGRRGKIKIVSKRIFIKGEPHYKVLHIQAATEDKLPRSYLQGYPCCYYVETYNFSERCNVKMLHVQWMENGEKMTHLIKIGNCYKVGEFEKLIKQIEASGERLASLIDCWRKMCFNNGNNIWKGNRIDDI